MGVSLSVPKRVKETLRRSPAFNSACASAYADCLSLSQHAFAGVKPYQLFSATEHLHGTLSHSLRLVSKWVPRPPDRAQVDRALKATLRRHGEIVALDEVEFKEFAAEVFAEAVGSGARMEVLKMVPLGVAGISGFGAVVRPGKEVVAAAIGAYALGVAASIYLSLDA